MHTSVLLFLGNLFSSDMIIIAFAALLLFGGEKLPEIARGLGKGIRDFKDASEGVKREINNQINSFEEKRQETALNNQAAAVQSQLAANNDHLIENHSSVENTIPVNDNNFTANEGTAVETHTEAPRETGTENHTVNTHNDILTSETTKTT